VYLYSLSQNHVPRSTLLSPIIIITLTPAHTIADAVFILLMEFDIPLVQTRGIYSKSDYFASCESL